MATQNDTNQGAINKTPKQLANEWANNGEGGLNAEEYQAYINIVGVEYAEQDQAEETFQGQWDSDEAFTQNLLEDSEPSLQDLPHYIHIDWEWTAEDIMMDYSEQDGYYFRNI